jgi:hypothetical protein
MALALDPTRVLGVLTREEKQTREPNKSVSEDPLRDALPLLATPSSERLESRTHEQEMRHDTHVRGST